MCWQRARSKEQIESRKQEILDAAYKLFEENEYESISLNGIARELRITKPSIYRYFSSREEIFLEIYSNVFASFYNDLMQELSNLSVDLLPENVSGIWAEVYKRHDKLLKLMPLLGIALEKNSSEQTLRSFKRAKIDMQLNIARKITEIYPQLSIQDGFYIQYYAFLIASALWPLSNPNDAMEAVLSEYRYLNISNKFETVLSQGIEAHIKAFLSKKGG